MNKKAALRNQPLKCQRCRRKDATHSILNQFLLCKDCFEFTFHNQAKLEDRLIELAGMRGKP